MKPLDDEQRRKVLECVAWLFVGAFLLGFSIARAIWE
jgi:hypothetical protein